MRVVAHGAIVHVRRMHPLVAIWRVRVLIAPVGMEHFPPACCHISVLPEVARQRNEVATLRPAPGVERHGVHVGRVGVPPSENGSTTRTTDGNLDMK